MDQPNPVQVILLRQVWVDFCRQIEPRKGVKIRLGFCMQHSAEPSGFWAWSPPFWAWSAHPPPSPLCSATDLFHPLPTLLPSCLASFTRLISVALPAHEGKLWPSHQRTGSLHLHKVLYGAFVAATLVEHAFHQCFLFIGLGHVSNMVDGLDSPLCDYNLEHLLLIMFKFKGLDYKEK